MMGVARRSLFVIALIAAAAVASAEENTQVTSTVTNLDRMWYNFNREAATVGDGGFWVELRGLKLNEDDPKIGLNGYPVNDFERKNGSELTEISGGRFDLIGAYGLGSAELGIGHEDSPKIRELFTQTYRGSRYSFGYPACPDMSDQDKLFRLLQPERIGCRLTENWQIDPEQSTSAIIVHHPQAKYFNV